MIQAIIKAVPDIQFIGKPSNNPNSKNGLCWSAYGTFNFQDRSSLIAQAASFEDVVLLTYKVIKL